MPEPPPIPQSNLRRRSIRYGLAAIALFILALLALDRQTPPVLDRARQTSALLLDSQDHILRGFTTSQGTWRLPAQTTEVDPIYLRMLLAYEDQRFPSHPGVDPLAVARAAGQWLTHGRIVSGASTLTMQTARLLEPHPRTLVGKFSEMRRALQLERRYRKEEILGFYLTLAPYGGNLEGVRMAALAWFGKEPIRLTAAEAALLVALPQSPSRLRPDRFPNRARAARDKVLQRMEQLGVLTEQQVKEARQEPLPRQRWRLPFIAPHLADRLRTAQPNLTLHRSFIDRNLQQNLETLARQRQSVLEPYRSMAILVVANHDRRVLAYIGASDFFDTRRAGQVDMIRAIRSPGSTLKPLIYGLGFDDLLIHPETLIEDAPTRFGGYSPTN
ncbi:MAG: transglycosylase domain-containing protein, partial [Candidatus Contendobacter sp.]|nr:transglycosylase domain-containing protein [Candidatus Contendobacter sp.]